MNRYFVLALILIGCKSSPPSAKVTMSETIVVSPMKPAADAGSTPCTESQCMAIHKASGGWCPPVDPFGCTLTGGCYATAAAAQAGCAGNWCSTLSCSPIPQPQRASRNVTFVNKCNTKLSIHLTDPTPTNNPHLICPKVDSGVQPPNCKLFDVDAGATHVFAVPLVNSDAGYYDLP